MPAVNCELLLSNIEKIPVSAFQAQFGTAATHMVILTNGWEPTYIVRTEFWKDKLDAQQFVWATEKSANYVILSGTV